MRYGIEKDVDWEYMGALLAQSDDNNQAKCLKAFVKECLSWGTALQVEKQLAYTNAQLTDEERDTLSMLSFKR